MGFLDSINKKRFAGLVIFTIVYFLFIPLVPFGGVLMAPSYFFFNAGIWSSAAALPVILIMVYLVILYYWLLAAGFDRYLLNKKYGR